MKISKLFLLTSTVLISLIFFWYLHAVQAQTELQADFNHDGTVDLVDFEIWRQNRYPAVPVTLPPSATPIILSGTPTVTPTLTGVPTTMPSITPTSTVPTPTPTRTPTITSCRRLGQNCNLTTNLCCTGLTCAGGICRTPTR